MASQLHWKGCVWGTETGVKSCVPAAGPDLSRLTGVWLVCLGTMQIGLSDKIENTKCNWGFRKQGNDFSAYVYAQYFTEHAFKLKNHSLFT